MPNEEHGCEPVGELPHASSIEGSRFMKNQVCLISAALALSFALAGCKPKTEWSQPPTAQTAPSGPTELKLKFPVGGQMVRSIDVQSAFEFTVPGNPGSLKQETSAWQQYTLTVLKDREGGGHEVEMQFTGNRLKQMMNGQVQFDIDSSKKPGPGNNKQLAQMATALQKVLDAKVRFLLDASNQVQSVEGLGDLQSRMAVDERHDPSGTLKSMCNELFWKEFMHDGQELPARPISPGDTWPVQQEVLVGVLGEMFLTNTCTFKGWETHDQRNCARLEFEGTLTRPDQGPGPNGMDFSVEDGKISGVTWFELDRGISLETDADESFSLNVTVPNRPRRGAATAGADTMTISGPVTVKVVAKLDSAR